MEVLTWDDYFHLIEDVRLFLLYANATFIALTKILKF